MSVALKKSFNNCMFLIHTKHATGNLKNGGKKSMSILDNVFESDTKKNKNKKNSTGQHISKTKYSENENRQN